MFELHDMIIILYFPVSAVYSQKAFSTRPQCFPPDSTDDTS